MAEPTYADPVWHKGFRIFASDFMFAGYRYCYQHDDYDPTPNDPDGPPGDNRAGYAKSIDDAKFEIDSEFFCADCDRPVSSCVCEPKGTDNAG